MSSLQDTQKEQRTEGTDGGIGNWSVCQRQRRRRWSAEFIVWHSAYL